MRSIFNSSYHNPLIHEVVNSFLDDQDDEYDSDNQHHISAIAKTVFQHLENSGLSQNQIKNLDEDTVKKAINEVVISVKTPWKPNLDPTQLSHIQKILLNTMRGNLPAIKEILKNKSLLRAVIWKKNPSMMKEGRELINELFSDMNKQLNSRTQSSSETFHMEMIIGELLSLYPFLNPEQDENLSVPTLVNGKWELINYRVDRLPLTPDWMGSPLVAFGLIPETPSAPPLLLFKGTTYPTDDGFVLSLLTDINPFGAVGKYGFKLGKKKISSWLDAQTGTLKAKIYGKSLGGSLAWQTSLRFPEQVEKAMTYGAPGLGFKDLKRCQQLEHENKLPIIHFYCQKNDSVPAVNRVAKSGIQYYKTLGKHARKGVLSHADMYSTHEISIILKLDPHHESKRWLRIGLTALQIFASLFIFPVCAAIYAVKIISVQTLKFLKNAIFIKIKKPNKVLNNV